MCVCNDCYPQTAVSCGFDWIMDRKYSAMIFSELRSQDSFLFVKLMEDVRDHSKILDQCNISTSCILICL